MYTLTFVYMQGIGFCLPIFVHCHFMGFFVHAISWKIYSDFLHVPVTQPQYLT